MQQNTQNQQLIEQIEIFVDLLRFAFFQKELPPFSVEPNWQTILKISRRHLLSATICEAAKAASCPEDVLLEFQKDESRTLQRQVRFDVAYREVASAFDKAGISYLRLKGETFSKLYPKYGLRRFSDVDIFVSPFKRRKNDKIFSALGYGKAHRGGIHDIYKKPPMYNFEIHFALFSLDFEWSEYFSNVLSRCERVSPERGEYRFTSENLYAYALAHLCKHDESGTGFRGYLDFYLLHRSLAEKVDGEKLEGILQQAGLLTFQAHVLSVGEALFGGERCTADKETLYAVGTCTVYGLADIRMEKEVGRDGKRYLLKRFFPSYATIASNYPWVKSFPPLYLVAALYRILRLPFRKESLKMAIRQLRYYRTHTKNK